MFYSSLLEDRFSLLAFDIPVLFVARGRTFTVFLRRAVETQNTEKQYVTDSRLDCYVNLTLLIQHELFHKQ